jgi:transcriptional regulator with XRE-family HTH domain
MEAINEYAIQIMKKKRFECGWSQQELADYLNLSRGYIGDVENPKKQAKINLVHINELAKIFKCSPREFLPENPL